MKTWEIIVGSLIFAIIGVVIWAEVDFMVDHPECAFTSCVTIINK